MLWTKELENEKQPKQAKENIKNISIEIKTNNKKTLPDLYIVKNN